VLSLAQASFDGWLHDQMHDLANAWISFYTRASSSPRCSISSFAGVGARSMK